MEPTVKRGHAAAAIKRRAYAEEIAAGEEPHAGTPRGQRNEAIEEKRGLGAYLERGREWLQEMGQRVRDQGELAAHGMSSLVQGAARTMRPQYIIGTQIHGRKLRSLPPRCYVGFGVVWRPSALELKWMVADNR